MADYTMSENAKLDIVEIIKESKTIKDLFNAFAITPEDNILILKAICEMQQAKISELESKIARLGTI